VAQERVERRLAAILVADVVGYSRLVGENEAGTLAALKDHQARFIDPTIAEHQGRIVKLMGDGVLVEFASVVAAVECAVAIQRGMAERNSDVPEGRRIDFRIGVNSGDVIIDGEDIQGDGINVAARLETISKPGGICVSDLVYQSIRGKTELAFTDLGEQELKNIKMPIRAWRWEPDPVGTAGTSAAAGPAIEQEIKFCTAPDGVTIAYAVVGEGPPLVKAPNWLHNLEFDWQSPVWGHLLRALAKDHTLVRFDHRANGLSDWEVPEITFDSLVDDLAAVIDATGLERFPLLGISQGCAISIAYAVRNPDRVNKLILYGGWAKGSARRGSETDRQDRQMMVQMIRQGWGQNNPAFRQFFTTRFMPGATKEQMDWFNELQRMTISPENAARIVECSGNTDVSELLSQVSVPTLVLHCRDDGIAPFEQGRKMAALIPGSRFVPLEGQNHLILENEPAWLRFREEVSEFLAE
jgi:class 3 adenylate cyclase/pimeloyl-ACP methyl ester carboxylesterase